MERTCSIYTTKTNVRTEHRTSASSWGQLKSELSSKGLFDPRAMKAVERTTKTTYEVDSATLPSGDFSIFLLPTKNNSGASTFDEWKKACYAGLKNIL